MRKLIMSAVLVTSVLMAGCSKRAPDPTWLHVKTVTTATEYAVLKEFYSLHWDMQHYKLLYSNVKKRTKAPAEDTPPFCAEIMFMAANDYHDEDHDIYQRVTSFYPTIKTDCPIKEEDTKPMVADQAIPDVLLSTSAIEELGAVAKACNTAKVIIIARENLSRMTEAEAASIIKQCRLDKLREELNK